MVMRTDSVQLKTAKQHVAEVSTTHFYVVKYVSYSFCTYIFVILLYVSTILHVFCFQVLMSVS